MKLVIDRTRWQRGNPAGSSSLLNHKTGKMCCLGFYALAEGLTKYQIKDMSSPRAAVLIGTEYTAKDLTITPEKVPMHKLLAVTNYYADKEVAMMDNTKHCDSMMMVNDVPLGRMTKIMKDNEPVQIKLGSESEREAILTEMFADIDVEVTFIN